MEIWHGECDFCKDDKDFRERRIVQSTNDEMARICGKCIIEATKLLLEDE